MPELKKHETFETETFSKVEDVKVGDVLVLYYQSRNYDNRAVARVRVTNVTPKMFDVVLLNRRSLSTIRFRKSDGYVVGNNRGNFVRTLDWFAADQLN